MRCPRALRHFCLIFIGTTITAAAQQPTDLTRLDQATLQQRADAGEAAAQYELGKRIYSWGAPPVTAPKAIVWYRKAAEQGYTPAEVDLGYLYRSGRGTPQDQSQAFYWYKKAADQGDVNGEYQVGFSYRAGRGVSQDYSQAMAWFLKCSTYVSCSEQIGMMYAYGQGVEKDLTKARLWLQKAADGGDLTSKSMLADLNGTPLPLPPPAAQKTYAAQPAPAPQQSNAQQGTCAFVYSGNPVDPNGTDYSYGAAWSRTTIEDAQSAALAELRKTPGGDTIDPGTFNTLASGCTFGHGAVAGKLKTQWQTGALLGPGIYDVITANLAATTNDAVNTAMAGCSSTKGLGGDNEVCAVLEQW
jgi:TPR repeat protein